MNDCDYKSDEYLHGEFCTSPDFSDYLDLIEKVEAIRREIAEQEQ